MRLPQDYILHIESAKDGVHITAEWQGELVRCKDCRHQRFYINDKESFHCDKSGIVNMHIDDGDGDFFCKYGERKE